MKLLIGFLRDKIGVMLYNITYALLIITLLITSCADQSKSDSSIVIGIFYEQFIGGILEEGFSGRGMFGPPTDPLLEGKTGLYEYNTDRPKKADIKFIKFIEGVAHEVGYLIPKMPIDDVFKIQE